MSRFLHSSCSRLLARTFCAVGLVILASLASFASTPVNVEVSPRKITVGDPVEMRLTLNAPAGSSVVWPIGEQLAPAEVIRTDTSASSGAQKSILYILSLFEPGKQELPDLPILILTEAGTDTVWIDPGLVTVESISNERDTALVDIRPPVKLPWTFREMLPYIIGGLVALAAAVGGYILWRRAKLRRGEIPVYVPPPLPPDVIALRKLEELRAKKLWQDGHIKAFHSELTEILKEYIGALSDFNALEMTTEELLLSRSRWARDDDGFSSVKRILTIADSIKFAKYKPEIAVHDKSLELVFAYVKATQPKPLEPTVKTAEVG